MESTNENLRFETTPFIIIDGLSQLRRAMHAPAYSEIKNGAAYGFIKILSGICHKFKPKGVLIVWDGGRSQRRMSLFDKYKIQREAINPEDQAEKDLRDKIIAEQKRIVVEVTSLLGVPSIEIPEIEADDVIGRIVEDGREFFSENIVVVTEDTDYLQLVSSYTKIYRPIVSLFISAENFAETLSYPLGFTVPYQAIVGKPSNNLTGVPGVGKKSAYEFLTAFVKTFDYPPTDYEGYTKYILDFARKSGSSRIRKIYEHQKLFFFMIEMVDFRYEFVPHDIIQLCEQKTIDAKGTYNQKDTLTALEKYSMFSLIGDYSSWADPFIVANQTNKLSGMTLDEIFS